MLKLPDVTLVMVETREHKLAAMAVEECLKVAEFGAVLILTDKPVEFAGIVGNYHYVPDWPNKLGWSRAWWFEVPPLVRTRQTLNIQWDSWIWDPSMWTDAFMEYDYIGAPWWYRDGKNVGNGGFSLISTRLKRYIADRRLEFPCDTHVDDDLLCRKYRPVLEEAGFLWAPERVAHQFAFECSRPSDTSRHFGFHAMFNWPIVLPHDKVLERVSLAVASPYIRESYMMKAFCQQHPGIIKELRDKTVAEGESECLQSAPS
jgi:hypothetical protein